MHTPITQSKSWQKLQDDLGETSFFEKTKDFQYLAIQKSTPVGKYFYLPYGPVAKDQAGFKKALKSLAQLAKAHSAIFVRVEPQLQPVPSFVPYGAKPSKDLSPRETWLLDLTGSDEDYRSRLPSRLLRYHRNATKNGIAIETTHDPKEIHHLIALQSALAKEKHISIFSEKYLGTELAQPFATLYLAKYQNPETTEPEVIAAGLVFDDDHTRYNLQGAQSDTGRKLHATGILTIQLIADAREKGLNSFDFWGIAPEGADASHPWYGFTSFKKTFAGHQVNYAGTHDIVFHPVKYRLYQLTRRINRLLRRA